jgi:cytochrome c oxidase subunit 2
MKFGAVTAIGHSVDHIAFALTIATVLLMGLVVFLLVYLGWKYRAGSPASREGRVSSSWKIELLNFSVILLLGAGAFIWSAKVFYHQFSGPANALELRVTGKQWMWIFEYPGGPREIGRIKVPVGRPIRVLLFSEDVIHSFFVPNFRIKQDVLPETYTSLWFQADKTGDYPVLCSELCGTEHSAMRATIEVVSEAEFEKYQNGFAPLNRSGEEVYTQARCASCHEIREIAPRLNHLYGSKVKLDGGKTVIADENYLRRALLEPAKEVVAGYRPLMPTYKGQLSDSDIAALLTFLKGNQ